MTTALIHSAIQQGLAMATEIPTLATDIPAVAAIQSLALDSWANSQWPTRKTEAWKYTPVKILATGNYFSALPPDLVTDDISRRYAIADLDAIELVFIDGGFNAELSADLNALPAGLNIVHLADADPNLLERYFNCAAAEHATLFGQLNTAVTHHGLFISVATNVQLTQPVHIVHVSSHQQECSVNARVLWQQDAHSQATLIEHFIGMEEAKVFTNSITELFVGDKALCSHYRLQLDNATSLHIGGVYSQLQKQSQLNSFYLAMGSNLQRIDVVTQFEGEGATANNNGVYLPRHKHLTDFHTCIEHKVPNCTSDESFRGIIGDSARAVFNGRIHIHKDAQKTLAELSNKNLLISDNAEIYTKPELEIYADDVRCAHGATVAQLDSLATYYLRSRGLTQEEAQVMLSFAFINELIEKLDSHAIRAYLRPIIAERFAKKTNLDRYLSGALND
jgi:Fe-S cluster assembly protein SufD